VRIVTKLAKFIQVRLHAAVRDVLKAMGPGLSDALAVSVFSPGMPQPSYSRVLRVPVRRLSAMMSCLHHQGAVVTHVGLIAGQVKPSESMGSDMAPTKASRKRNIRKEQDGPS
jgi:hypothetical protein